MSNIEEKPGEVKVMVTRDGDKTTLTAVGTNPVAVFQAAENALGPFRSNPPEQK